MLFHRLEKQIIEYCEKNYIQGVFRITVGDKVRLDTKIGFADIENKIDFTDDSMFSLYSLSKPFCAIGLLKLKDNGLINIDCHPFLYVPEAKGFDERVTIRHLLHHVSGLPDFEQNNEFKEKYAPGYAKYARKHLKILTGYPSYFSPGTDVKYANINFVLCALIIENVSGMNYSEYMKKEVFQPLGMKTAVIDNEQLTIFNRVQGYGLLNNELIKTDKVHDWTLGAGDIVATVDDVYCLNKAIKHRLLLKKETWQEILTPSPVCKFGMGCTLTTWHGKKRITHNGGHKGFRTLHIQLPDDDFDFIILSNSGFGNARDDIAEMVYDAFYGKDESFGESFTMDAGYI